MHHAPCRNVPRTAAIALVESSYRKWAIVAAQPSHSRADKVVPDSDAGLNARRAPRGGQVASGELRFATTDFRNSTDP